MSNSFMDDYFRTVLEKAETIRAANDEITKATLIAIGYQKGMEEAAANTAKADGSIDAGGSALSEDSMLIDLNGISVSSNPRKDGRYQGYITMPDGQKKYLYGRTVEEVKFKLKFYLQEYGAPKRKKRTIAKGPLFRDFAANWAEMYKKPTLKPKSYESVLRVLRIATKALGDKPIDGITSDDLQAFFVDMGATRTRDLCAVYVGQVFAHAARTEAIKRNPMDAVQLPKREKTKRSALTPEEQAAFLAAARGCTQELLFRFLLATGLRIGEALALTPDDLDAQKKSVRVNKDIVFLDDGRQIVQKPKTAAALRTVPVPADICKALAKIGTQRLFPVTYNTVRKAFERMSKACGIPVSAHILRHTYATRLEEAGIPPKVKQYLMGHASLDMTQGVYTDAQAHYVAEFSDRVRSTFAPRPTDN